MNGLNVDKKLLVICNEHMRELRDSVIINDEVVNMTNKYLGWCIHPNIVERCGLVIMLQPNENDSEINWEKFARNSFSFENTEWNSNELDCVNDYLPDDVDADLLKNVAFYIYNTWKKILKQKFPNYNFQVVIHREPEFDFYRLHFYRCRREDFIFVENTNGGGDILAEII